MIVTIAKVADFDQFLKTFWTKGAEKRKQQRVHRLPRLSRAR